MKTTLNQIRNNPRGKTPCETGRDKLLSSLGKTEADDEELSFLTIFDSNGMKDTIWVLGALTGFDNKLRLFAVWCARQVQHHMTDSRILTALDVAQRFAEGQATPEDLVKAGDAAVDAPMDNAGNAVRAATGDIAAEAAKAAAQWAVWAAREDWDEWEGEPRDAEIAAREAQKTEFRRMLECIERGERYEIGGTTAC